MCEEIKPEDQATPEDNQADQDQDELSLMKEQMEEALREKDQFRALAQRAQADLTNYKRRAADQMDELRRSAKEQLILKVLGVIDDFSRAIEMIPQDAVAPGWFEGLEFVGKNFQTILDSEGISKIEAKGQPFEPWEHEAVFFEETDEVEEGTVVRVIREGYKFRDRVLRAAQVSVSKPTEQGNQSETTQQEA